ncbi:MAG: HipA family kinase [Polaromonas sp.]
MPLQHPEIVEVWERAEQGQANAYRCGADDGHSYYVKSAGATWRSLVCEWVGGRLALALGLPIAPFAQVHIDEQFASFLQQAGNRHLVGGLAFGSCAAAHTREFDPTLLPHCQPAFRRDLVAFDWWVRNADRTLGDLSGNPNLLWDVAAGSPVVIDHNMAFDLDFGPQQFSQTHIFRRDWADLAADWVLRAEYEQRFAALVPLLSEIWAELPQNWLETEDGTVRFQRSDFHAVLDRVNHPGFWDLA